MADAVRIEESTSGERLAGRYLNASLLISSVGIAASVAGWWAVRLYNENAADEGRRMKDMLSVDWSESTLPFLLFILFVVGVCAFALALMGVRAVGHEAWQVSATRAVVAGALSALLMAVPLVVLANSMVTAGLSNMGMGD